MSYVSVGIVSHSALSNKNCVDDKIMQTILLFYLKMKCLLNRIVTGDVAWVYHQDIPMTQKMENTIFCGKLDGQFSLTQRKFSELSICIKNYTDQTYLYI